MSISDSTPGLSVSSPASGTMHLKGSAALLAPAKPAKASMLSNFTHRQGTHHSVSAALHSLAADKIDRKGSQSTPPRLASTVNPMSPQSSCSSGCQLPSDYHTHPAAADAALHLGAVPIEPAQGPSRVPVALEGLLANSGETFGASGAPGWAAAAVPAAAADVPVLTSNALWHSARSGRMTVSGLAAKLLPVQVSSLLLLIYKNSGWDAAYVPCSIWSSILYLS